MHVDLGDQRAGGVMHGQGAGAGFGLHMGGDAMGGKDRHRAIGHIVEVLDKHGALGPQTVHDMGVVDDFMADIDGPRMRIDGAFDNGDGAFHPGAKATRPRQKDGEGRKGPR
jgi:hypothetical protein